MNGLPSLHSAANSDGGGAAAAAGAVVIEIDIIYAFSWN